MVRVASHVPSREQSRTRSVSGIGSLTRPVPSALTRQVSNLSRSLPTGDPIITCLPLFVQKGCPCRSKIRRGAIFAGHVVDPDASLIVVGIWTKARMTMYRPSGDTGPGPSESPLKIGRHFPVFGSIATMPVKPSSSPLLESSAARTMISPPSSLPFRDGSSFLDTGDADVAAVAGLQVAAPGLPPSGARTRRYQR